MAQYWVRILQERRFTLEIEADSVQAVLAIADKGPLPFESDSTNEEVLDVRLAEKVPA
jgi:hypothetical protein